MTILSCYTDISFYIVVLEGGGGGGVGDPYFFLHISSSWVKTRLDTENQLPRSSGSALKVCVVGWWWWWGGGGGGFHLIMWSHQLRLGLKLGCDNFQGCPILYVWL